MAEKTLEIRIKQIVEGKNSVGELNKQIRDLKSEMTKLSLAGKQGGTEWNNYANQLKQLTSLQQGLNTQFKSLIPSVNGTNTSLLGMIGTIGAITAGVAAGVTALISFTKELLQVASVGAEFNVLKQGFVDLSGGVEQSKESLELFSKALAGNLDNKKIMEFANSFRLLGESDDEIAKFFDIAESRTELFGGSIETAIGQLQRFIETGNKKGGLGLKFDITAIEKEMAKLGNTTVENIKKLSDEDQQILRKQAIYKLYGKTLDEINQKKKDEADSLKSLFTLYENIKQTITSLISTGLKPFIEFINKIIDYLGQMELSLDGLNDKFPELQKTLEFTGQVFKRFGEDALNSIKVFINANVKLISAVGYATGVVISTVVKGVLFVAKAIREIVALTNKIGGVIGITLDGSGIDAIISNLEKLSEVSAKNGTKDLSTLADSNDRINNNSKNNSKNNDTNEETKEIRALGKEVVRLAIQYIELAKVADLPIGKANRKNTGIPNLKPLNPNQKESDINDEVDRLLNSASDNFQSMVNSTVSMLQNLNLMETGFGQILNGIVQVINIFKSAFDVGNSIFGFITSLISLIPGGGVVSGVLNVAGGAVTGGGGGSGFGSGNGKLTTMMGGMNRNISSPNITVVVHSEVEKTKAVKFFQNNFSDYQNRQSKKVL